MAANGAVEPKTSDEKTSEVGTYQLVSLVLDGGLTVAQAWRLAMAHHGYGGTYSAATATVRRARAERSSTDDPQALARRMLRILSAELSALERTKGPRDLDRLAKLAQTLGQLDRLRPKAGKRKEEPALLGLLRSSNGSPDVEAEADPKDLSEEEEGVRLAEAP